MSCLESVTVCRQRECLGVADLWENTSHRVLAVLSFGVKRNRRLDVSPHFQKVKRKLLGELMWFALRTHNCLQFPWRLDPPAIHLCLCTSSPRSCTCSRFFVSYPLCGGKGPVSESPDFIKIFALSPRSPEECTSLILS